MERSASPFSEEGLAFFGKLSQPLKKAAAIFHVDLFKKLLVSAAQLLLDCPELTGLNVLDAPFDLHKTLSGNWYSTQL